MNKYKIDILKMYRNILIELKKIELNSILSKAVEDKIYTYGGEKPKMLVLKKWKKKLKFK